MPVAWWQTSHNAPGVVEFATQLQHFIRSRQREEALWAMVIAVDAEGAHIYALGPTPPEDHDIASTLEMLVDEYHQ